jgi:hypothetical protein
MLERGSRENASGLFEPKARWQRLEASATIYTHTSSAFPCRNPFPRNDVSIRYGRTPLIAVSIDPAFIFIIIYKKLDKAITT